MKFKKILMIFGLILLVIFLLVCLSTYRGFTGGKRIDVTRLQRSDHPLFAGDKREDNSIDYVAAIERVTQQNVTTENNFGVAIFELAPNDSELSPETRRRYRDKLEFNEESEFRFHTIDQLLRENNSTMDRNAFAQLIASTTVESFVNDDPDDPIEKTLRATIAIETPSLDRLVLELDRRPEYYVPLIGLEGNTTLIMILLPHAQHQRQFARWLVLRSNQNLADGNMVAAWKDIRAMYQLGNRVSRGFTLVEYLVGVAVVGMANGQMERLLNLPGVSPELLEEIAQELPAVAQLPPWTQSFDLGERAMMLNFYDEMVEGRLESMDFGNGTGTPSGKGMPMGWVDSVQLGDDWNQMVDRIIAAAEKGNPECQEEFAKIESELAAMRVQGADIGWLVGKAMLGARPKKEATKIAETMLFGLLTPAVKQVHDASVRIEAQLNLVQLAIASRRYEIQHQQLPSNLQSLSSFVEPNVMIDPFSESELVLEIIAQLDGEVDPEGNNPVLRMRSAGNFPSPEVWRVDLLPSNQIRPPEPLSDEQP